MFMKYVVCSHLDTVLTGSDLFYRFVYSKLLEQKQLVPKENVSHLRHCLESMSLKTSSAHRAPPKPPLHSAYSPVSHINAKW